MSLPAAALASYQTVLSANVPGTRRPYHRLGGTRRVARGQASPTKRIPSKGNTTSVDTGACQAKPVSVISPVRGVGRDCPSVQLLHRPAVVVENCPELLQLLRG